VTAAGYLAAAIALAGALTAAGCGLGAGASVGDATLSVTRDYGAKPLLRSQLYDVKESDTVLRTLDRSTDITTRYGGGFVQSINGIAGESRQGRRYDWFFYVNGIESSTGAADVSLHDGDRVWWDYRDWTSAMSVPAVVGSFPAPFADGYEGKRHPTEVVCRTRRPTCAAVRQSLAEAGARIGRGDEAIRVLVGPWAALRADPAAARVAKGPAFSGVFAEPRPTAAGLRLYGLSADGATTTAFGPGAGLVAATRRYSEPPVWLVTGTTTAGVRAAASLLDPADLRDHYAVAIDGGKKTPLPTP
jgi:hypothetical protein